MKVSSIRDKTNRGGEGGGRQDILSIRDKTNRGGVVLSSI